MDSLSRRLFDANDPDSTGIVRTLPEIPDGDQTVGQQNAGREPTGIARSLSGVRETAVYSFTPRTRCCSRLGTAKVKKVPTRPGASRPFVCRRTIRQTKVLVQGLAST